MVKSKVLDNGRGFLFCFVLRRKKKGKNQSILLIHVLSHEAIISKARHASYVTVTSSVLLYLLHEQFSHGGEAGYSQEHSYSLKIIRIFWFPEVLRARLIIPVCCFSHSHFPLGITTSLLFIILRFDPRLSNQRINTYFFSICSTGYRGESSIWLPYSSWWWKLQSLGWEPVAWFSDLLLVWMPKF